jgi:Deoxycytidylate deaminase
MDDITMKMDAPTIQEILNTQNKISWDAYFMNVALLVSMRSSDINTKVGSVIVDKMNRIIGCGYNGFVRGIDETKFPTSRDTNLPFNETKYAYTVHSEANALLNTTVFDLTGSKIYCTLFPCNSCALLLLQKGISEVIYLSDKHHNDPPYIASRKLFDAAGIIVRQYDDKLLL